MTISFLNVAVRRKLLMASCRVKLHKNIGIHPRIELKTIGAGIRQALIYQDYFRYIFVRNGDDFITD